MARCVLAIGTLLVLPTLAAGAQTSQVREAALLSCTWYDSSRSHLGTTRLSNGYTVTVTRAKDPAEDQCAVSVRAPGGREVHRGAGFAAGIEDPAIDVNGDGAAELVLTMDVGGGNHCCWKFVVLTFRPVPRVLFEFDWTGATRFRKDPAGRVTLWAWEGGLYGTDGSMAGRLFAQRVYRWNGTKLVDETPAHCRATDADTTRYQERLPDADAIRRLEKFGVNHDSTYGIAGAIEGLMLQDIFCHRFARALDLARMLWPPRRVPRSSRTIGILWCGRIRSMRTRYGIGGKGGQVRRLHATFPPPSPGP